MPFLHLKPRRTSPYPPTSRPSVASSHTISASPAPLYLTVPSTLAPAPQVLPCYFCICSPTIPHRTFLAPLRSLMHAIKSLFVISIHPFRSPPPTSEKSVRIPHKKGRGSILTANLNVTRHRPRQFRLFSTEEWCRTSPHRFLVFSHVNASWVQCDCKFTCGAADRSRNSGFF